MSIIAYGYGRGGDGVQTVELGEVALVDPTIVVELQPARRIVDLPAVLDVALADTGLSVALGGGLDIALTDDSLDVDLE
jgi:hypothetical protein